MSSTQENNLVQANKAYAEKFDTPNLPLPPAKKVGIITCMDTRLNPQAAYGIELGEALIIRNAGASTKDAARSVLAATHLLGVEEVFVVKHTRCGLLGVTTEQVHHVMKGNLSADKAEAVDGFEVLPIADLEKSAKEDVEWLRKHPLAMGKVKVTGWIHDTDTGLVKKVVE